MNRQIPSLRWPVNRMMNHWMMAASSAAYPHKPTQIMCGIARMMRKAVVSRFLGSVYWTS